MPQSNQTGEFNTFVGGLVTEASPLTFPENASIDEANFVLNKDGSRRRRLGMDYEEGLTKHPVSYPVTPIGDPKVVTYEWSDVAGIPNKSFIVCQIHDKAYIIDRTDDTLKSSSWVKHELDLCSTCQTPNFASFASVNGTLVIAYGEPEFKIVTYDEVGDSFSEEERRIKTRDLWGVEDKFTHNGTEVDLLSPEYVNLRPASAASEDAHIYNLRNQGWAAPRQKMGTDIKDDPVAYFETTATNNLLPSNADTPVTSLMQDGADPSEHFNAQAQVRLEPSAFRAAVGHYVIDLLARGTSRQEAIVRTTSTTDGLYVDANPTTVPSYITYRTPTVVLPADTTDGGAHVVSEFAGRVFFGGFSSQNTGADSQSPNLASYVFYSQLIKDSSQINRCYQEGDPTGPEAPDILETDGGFIRIAGAYNIQRMVDVGRVLMVIAENGVWAIGGSDTGIFSATNQSVTKITEHGTTAPESVVLVEGTLMYWSDDAIYHIAPDNLGNWQPKELSVNIRRYYQGIDSDSKIHCQGSYDSYEKKVRWLYNNTPSSTEDPTELVFDVVLAAFYPSVIGKLGSGDNPIPVAPIQVSPYNIAINDLVVYAGADEVYAGTELVVAATAGVASGFRETAYLTLCNSVDSSNTTLTFSAYRDRSFLDWVSENSVGVDAPAFLLTGYIGNGDVHRFKQVPYIYFHFLRTEDGFTEVGDDLVPNNQSSCLVQSQWDWTNSAAYGKWSKSFQAYRYRRNYIAEDSADLYDYGTQTIVSRNKLRGRGRVVSLLISSEAGKDMNLLGWSMTIGMNNNG